MPNISIIVPVYNEEALLSVAIDDLTTKLKTEGLPFKLILSENGSTDATATLAGSLAQQHRCLEVLSTPVADYGSAIRAGIKASDTPYIVVFDIDYYDIGFLQQALTLLQDYDIVIASKLAPEAQDKRNLARRAITHGFSLIVRGLFGTKTSETHGMKAFRREAILPVFQQTRLGKDLFDTELIVRAERSGLRIKEIPVVVEEKRPSRSSMLKRIPRTIVGLLRLRYLLWTEN